MPAPQNRTHNTQLINNARHKNHEVVYARKFIPTKILDYQFFEIPRNIITRNFLRIWYVANMEKFKFDIHHSLHMECIKYSYLHHICYTCETDITVDIYFKFTNVQIYNYGMLMAYGRNVLHKSYLI